MNDNNATIVNVLVYFCNSPYVTNLYSCKSHSTQSDWSEDSRLRHNKEAGPKQHQVTIYGSSLGMTVPKLKLAHFTAQCRVTN